MKHWGPWCCGSRVFQTEGYKFNILAKSSNQQACAQVYAHHVPDVWWRSIFRSLRVCRQLPLHKQFGEELRNPFHVLVLWKKLFIFYVNRSWDWLFILKTRIDRVDRVVPPFPEQYFGKIPVRTTIHLNMAERISGFEGWAWAP